MYQKKSILCEQGQKPIDAVVGGLIATMPNNSIQYINTIYK